MALLKKTLIGTSAFIVAIGAAGLVVYGGGEHEGPGAITEKALPDAAVLARAVRQKEASAVLNPGTPAPKQILFGDLHVHTTFSADAFMRSLPLTNGEGAKPPADACDYARFCSDLDFFSFNDHAEALTQQHWEETKEVIRQCNAVSGDSKNPDLVVFAGWEWSQVGMTPADHYGHKNVIFRDTEEAKLPKRVIGSAGAIGAMLRNVKSADGNPLTPALVPLLDFPDRDRYMDFFLYQRELSAMADCPAGVDTRELPLDCREAAPTPDLLFEKLGQWGFDSIVIPHGTTWGFYTPPGYTYDKQLSRKMHDPSKQSLLEIYSGHGNSEEYRTWRAIKTDGDDVICPEPTANYEPCCWRAGEIIRDRCADAPKEECDRRVEEAKKNYASSGVAGHQTISGVSVEEWGDCGQCRDCFNQSFSYRPAASAQYILAKGNFDDPEKPNYAPMGFIASSDNHSARPGTGYKEHQRRRNTEASGPRSAEWRDRFMGAPTEPTPESKKMTIEAAMKLAAFQAVHLERQASFFMTGGLVAVHSEGRSREEIWDAMKRREVYGTSGDRMLLWFDQIDGEDATHITPMGSDSTSGVAPRFRVRAAGSFAQKPGCPEWSTSSLSKERLEALCFGECYNPSDVRRKITRIEVIRISPQVSANEPVETLIQDAWKTFECAPSQDGCTVEFEDPDFVAGARDVIYYVRAIQEPTLAVNAGGVRCDYDADGNCINAKPCFGDFKTPMDDDCLTENEERAWSSPIFVHFDATAVAQLDEAGQHGTDADSPVPTDAVKDAAARAVAPKPAVVPVGGSR